MKEHPTVSIIINTDGRATILKNTLASLSYLRYPRFEVVVVPGPTRDGTHEMLDALRDRIKVGYCPDRNISRSRNIAVEISSGELIAFLDDDEIPEPEWLDDLVPELEDPAVAVASGFLHDHTGKGYQSRYETVNRFGTPDGSWGRPTPEFNFPLSFNFPHAMINSPFRRSAIVDVGGFDEEYEYYLDETDLICRMVDRGWRVTQTNRGFVHHKFLSNATRDERRVKTSWYIVIKNKAYFALVNGSRFATTGRILNEIEAFIDGERRILEADIEQGYLSEEYRERFEREANQALRDGLERGLRGIRRLGDPNRLLGDRGGFLPFTTLLPAAEQRCYVFLSGSYPPAAPNGIARYVHHLARGIAAQGHQVHVLTRDEKDDRIDFEEGVWVHRIVAREFPGSRPPVGAPIPRSVWNYSMTMLAEAREVATRRPIDCIHAPLWNAEAIAFMDCPWPVVVSTHSALRSYLDGNPQIRVDATLMQSFVEPMLLAERELLARSTGVVLHSRASLEMIERAYDIQLTPERIRILPHGLADESGLPARPPRALPEGMVRLVFVGRLESRKGIELLLEIVPDLLGRNPHLWLDVVGGDALYRSAGQAWVRNYATDRSAEPFMSRLAFHGQIPEERLRGLYRTADIVIAPSPFDGSGLVPIEAMMFGKPVIGCRAGGTPEIIEHGRTGLLVEPADGASLRDSIEELVRDPELRRRMGEAGRREFLARFTAARMAASEAQFLQDLVQRRAYAPLGRPTTEAAVAVAAR